MCVYKQRMAHYESSDSDNDALRAYSDGEDANTEPPEPLANGKPHPLPVRRPRTMSVNKALNKAEAQRIKDYRLKMVTPHYSDLSRTIRARPIDDIADPVDRFGNYLIELLGDTPTATNYSGETIYRCSRCDRWFKMRLSKFMRMVDGIQTLIDVKLIDEEYGSATRRSPGGGNIFFHRDVKDNRDCGINIGSETWSKNAILFNTVQLQEIEEIRKERAGPPARYYHVCLCQQDKPVGNQRKEWASPQDYYMHVTNSFSLKTQPLLLIAIDGSVWYTWK